VPAYAIVGGVPAKLIKYRFSQDQIEKLQSVKLYDLDEKQILKIREQLQGDDINQLIEFLKAAE
jgi:chloramphenicol O-acetyltransferase type B